MAVFNDARVDLLRRSLRKATNRKNNPRRGREKTGFRIKINEINKQQFRRYYHHQRKGGLLFTESEHLKTKLILQ